MSLGTAKESRVEPGLRHMQHKAAHSPFVSALVDSHRTCDKVVARMQLISERREVASSHITKRNLLKRRSLLSLADKAQSIQLTGGRVGASSAAIFVDRIRCRGVARKSLCSKNQVQGSC